MNGPRQPAAGMWWCLRQVAGGGRRASAAVSQLAAGVPGTACSDFVAPSATSGQPGETARARAPARAAATEGCTEACARQTPRACTTAAGRSPGTRSSSSWLRVRAESAKRVSGHQAAGSLRLHSACVPAAGVGGAGARLDAPIGRRKSRGAPHVTSWRAAASPHACMHLPVGTRPGMQKRSRLFSSGCKPYR